jgi:uncharacterized protein (DUF433 family)
MQFRNILEEVFGDSNSVTRKRRSMTVLLGNGIYTFNEAARLTRLKTARVREWFRRKATFQTDYQPVDRDFAMSFYDLIDVFVVGRLREHGVSMPTVRHVYARMTEDLASPHPFCRAELMTQGKSVFVRNAGSDEARFNEIITKQSVYTKVLLPFLKTIDYDEITLLAKRWRIAESVIIDPQICFGSPIVDQVGIPTSILATAYEANDEDAAAVANWYGVDPKAVLVAVTFERRLAV